MLTINEIMTTKLVTLGPDATLKDAHEMTREQGVRHLPVVDENGKLLSLVTQKALVSKVISLLTLYGANALERRESWTSIKEVAVPAEECSRIKATDTVRDVARYFLDNRHGCLPVLDDYGVLIGIVTSSDFVRLAAQLLEKTEC
ncbi:HPP family protein [Bowmanella sp. JS7-9]|uniref:HPP family protein n=1 Tax=Pseudobowmanella zhangzhouensis TaxID=1537679 RepID=A0ABW1XKP8_9ALTE|nr:CBS domain-containing protein [Bowmanella sp. JS7-9]TBX24578.1 hypothetical protein TK45_04730 [Bowmanella sp. JS7-9]